MTKRYGRNQKRQHRERIAELEQRLHLAHATNFSLVQRLREQEEHVCEIAETINEVIKYSALLPPRSVNHQVYHENPLRMRLAPRRSIKIATGQEWIRPEDVSFNLLTLDLWLLEAILEENIGAFEKLVHVLVPGPGGLRYHVTEEAFRQYVSGPGGLPELARALYGKILGALRQGATR